MIENVVYGLCIDAYLQNQWWKNSWNHPLFRYPYYLINEKSISLIQIGSFLALKTKPGAIHLLPSPSNESLPISAAFKYLKSYSGNCLFLSTTRIKFECESKLEIDFFHKKFSGFCWSLVIYFFKFSLNRKWWI